MTPYPSSLISYIHPELSRRREEWEHLFWSVGTLTDVEWHGNPNDRVRSSGLVRTRGQPTHASTRKRYYPPLCLIFILTGLHHDYYIAGRRTDPIAIGMGRLRALLREYENDHRPPQIAKSRRLAPKRALQNSPHLCPVQAVHEGRKAHIGDELRCLACDKPTLRT